MPQVAKIDSNSSELAWAEESSIGTLPSVPVWYPAEPNSYGDTGGETTTVAREPITSDRQIRKGTVTDLDAVVDYESDFTQTNLADQMQGYLFANFRRKAEFAISNKISNDTALGTLITGVVAATDTFTIVTGSGSTNFTVGQKIRTRGFTNSGNNGTFTVSAVTATTIVVSESLTDEASPPSTASIANAVCSVTNSTSTFTITKNGTTFRAGDLIRASGFTNTGNNGVFRVSSVTATTVVITGATLTDEATPPEAAKLVVVGFQFASGDLTLTNSGSAYPTLGATAKDLTQLGLVPGEWIFIGDGADAAYKFATAANNGFARVRSVTATTITLDKTYTTIVTDAGTSKTIRLYVGRVLKNEQAASIVRRTYNFERKLGAPDSSNLSQIQSEYVVGATPSELEITVPKANKVTCKLKYVGIDHETREAATGVKTGTRQSLTAEDAFNTSSDISYLKLATVSATNANPDALFGYLSDLSITINNNLAPNKALANLGAFDITAGNFNVAAKMTAYFANVTATAAVRANTTLTLDLQFVKNNKGVAIDLPSLTASKNINNVKKNEPIEVPLEGGASSAVEVDSTLNHTMLMVFFDYLPSLADV